MPWEKTYGYAQAVRVGDTLYVSGQLGHDDAGNIVGAAPPDAHGNDVDHSNMAAQMRQAYVNAAKVLGLLGATLQHVVEEVLYSSPRRVLLFPHSSSRSDSLREFEEYDPRGATRATDHRRPR